MAGYLCSWVGRLTIVKVVILLKYVDSTTYLSKSQLPVFRNRQANPKNHMEKQETQNTQIVLGKKQN